MTAPGPYRLSWRLKKLETQEPGGGLRECGAVEGASGGACLPLAQGRGIATWALAVTSGHGPWKLGGPCALPQAGQQCTAGWQRLHGHKIQPRPGQHVLRGCWERNNGENSLAQRTQSIRPLWLGARKLHAAPRLPQGADAGVKS